MSIPKWMDINMDMLQPNDIVKDRWTIVRICLFAFILKLHRK